MYTKPVLLLKHKKTSIRFKYLRSALGQGHCCLMAKYFYKDISVFDNYLFAKTPRYLAAIYIIVYCRLDSDWTLKQSNSTHSVSRQEKNKTKPSLSTVLVEYFFIFPVSMFAFWTSCLQQQSLVLHKLILYTYSPPPPHSVTLNNTTFLKKNTHKFFFLNSEFFWIFFCYIQHSR